MRSFYIAEMTFFELIRNRILYGLMVFAMLLMGFSIALGELTFDERERLTVNLSLTSIHLVMMIICVFLGCALMTKEFERRTYMTILTRPVSRAQFLFGKFLGLTGIVALVIFFLMVISNMVLWGQLFSLKFWALIYLGLLLEAMVLIATALLLSVCTQFFIAVVATFGIFLIGHWLNQLKFFAEKSESQLFKMFSDVINVILPNLERFNWRSLVHGYFKVSGSEVIGAVFHGIGWAMILLTVAMMVLRKKDLV